jgi:hypothetical protein
MDYMTPRPFETGAVTCRLEKEPSAQSCSVEMREASCQLCKHVSVKLDSIETVEASRKLYEEPFGQSAGTESKETDINLEKELSVKSSSVETEEADHQLSEEHLAQSACTESQEANGSLGKESSATYRSFEIVGSRMPLDSVNSRNIVLRRQTGFRFKYEVTLDIPMSPEPGENSLKEGQCAGITGYYDENTFLEFGITARNNGIYIYSREHIGDEDKIKIGPQLLPGSIRLRMDTDYLTRRLSYKIFSENSIASTGYTSFTTLESVNYLCDEGLRKGKRFTGALVGMYAYRGDEDLKVRFHHDLYQDS